MNKIHYLLILLFALSSCLSERQQRLTLEGSFSGAGNQKIVLGALGIREIRPIDSVVLADNGTFAFEIPDPDTGFLLVQGPGRKYLILVTEGPAAIRLSGDFSGFPDRITVEGSPESKDLQRFFKFSNDNARKADSIMKILRQHVDSTDYSAVSLRTDSLLNAIWLHQKDLGTKYISVHPRDLSSLIVINYTFGVQAVIPIHEAYNIYKKLSDSLKARYPSNEHVVHFAKTVDNYKPGSIKLAP